jgi:hypothetical protein
MPKLQLQGLTLDMDAIKKDDDFETSVEFTDVGALKFAGFTVGPNGISVAPKPKRRSSLKKRQGSRVAHGRRVRASVRARLLGHTEACA